MVEAIVPEAVRGSMLVLVPVATEELVALLFCTFCGVDESVPVAIELLRLCDTFF